MQTLVPALISVCFKHPPPHISVAGCGDLSSRQLAGKKLTRAQTYLTDCSLIWHLSCTSLDCAKPACMRFIPNHPHHDLHMHIVTEMGLWCSSVLTPPSFVILHAPTRCCWPLFLSPNPSPHLCFPFTITWTSLASNTPVPSSHAC